MQFPQEGVAQNSHPSDTLKVTSYNIRNAKAKDKKNSWKYRCPGTILMLKDQLPDVIGVQEAFESQVSYIDQYLKEYNWYGVGRNNGKRRGEHTAIFYNTKRIRMEEHGTFWLSGRPEKPTRGWDGLCKRTATWAVMTHLGSGKRFMVINTHLDHVGKRARVKGLELVARFIEEKNTDGLPVVLMGDFNVPLKDKCLQPLEGKMIPVREAAQVTDSLPSFHGWGKDAQTIDYIYESGFSEINKFKTITKKYGEWKFISDHYPISTWLVF